MPFCAFSHSAVGYVKWNWSLGLPDAVVAVVFSTSKYAMGVVKLCGWYEVGTSRYHRYVSSIQLRTHVSSSSRVPGLSMLLPLRGASQRFATVDAATSAEGSVGVTGGTTAAVSLPPPPPPQALNSNAMERTTGRARGTGKEEKRRERMTNFPKRNYRKIIMRFASKRCFL